jgi:chemotaxis protein CheD
MFPHDPTSKYTSGPGAPPGASATAAAAPEPTYVPPGRLLAVADARSLTTIASTGAVVCLWDPVSGVGGMAHFLLPEAGASPKATRFGDVAVAQLVDDLAKLGAPERRLRARLYGGSAPPLVTHGGHLGDHNIEAATAILGRRHVPIMARETGGDTARKIIFSPKAGSAEVTRISLSWTQSPGSNPASSHGA